MPVEAKVFASEEERISAIEALGDDPAKFEELESIRNAKIGTAPAETNPDGQKPSEPPAETPPAPAGAAPAKPAETKTFTITDKDLPEGFDTPGKVFKSFVEAQELIKRQTNFIKENLNKPAATNAESEATERARKAEEELARIRSSAPAGQPQGSTTADISTVQTEIQRIEAMQDELEKQAEEDPDVAFTGEYQRKQRELSRLQTKNLNLLTTLYSNAKTEIQQAKTLADGIVTQQKQSKEDEAAATARQNLYNEMTALDVPELKLSKKAEDVEADYLQWRRDVSLAYYGRPAANVEEEFKALEQLQIKNPDTIQKCALIGVKAEPSEDVKRYIQNCEYLDYQMGWRKDPATGKFFRLTKFDPATNQTVPLILPSLKAAIQQKRVEEGFYEKQVDGAFQKGAQSVAAAAQRRDMGAVELNERGDQGQTPASAEWALRTMQDIDAETAELERRRGNPAKLNELNKARVALGLQEITFIEG